MGKCLELTMKCGCKIWDGNDYMGKGFLFIERCDYHEYIDQEGPEDRQLKDLAGTKCQCSWDYVTGSSPYYFCGKCGEPMRR